MIIKNTYFFRLILILTLWCCLHFTMQAQETLAVGQVLNAFDKSGVPDVNIFFKNTQIGTKSNEEGYFMIRTSGEETTLVFSAVGFRSKEIKIKKGQSAGIQVELKEQFVELYEVVVIPGANPALPFMRKVREARPRNDYGNVFTATTNEQNLVYLGNINRNSLKRKLFSQLSEGVLQDADSSLLLPLFMSEKKISKRKATISILSENFFSSKPENEGLLVSLTGENGSDINFYRNAITLYGQSFVSPLSTPGNAYYNFYLADSTYNGNRKEYQINFRSKNYKNLAFNGFMRIDSATLALTFIDATLPAEANLNYVHQLRIIQDFEETAGMFVPQTEQFSSNMTYELLADSINAKPQIYIRKKTTASEMDVSATNDKHFAGTDMDAQRIDSSMVILGNTPIVRFAKWLADVVITGYIPAGKIDIGKVQNLARLTDIEGFRLTLPFRSNELFSEKMAFNGHIGYGFRNNTLKYSAGFQYKIPMENRFIFNAGYTDDYRRMDYDYNDFLLRENPLLSGDEDIAVTLLGFRSAKKMNERKEFQASLTYDWNKDIESSLFYRHHILGSPSFMPFIQNGNQLAHITQQSITLNTRFSFGEKVYDNHFQRIYISNYKPVIYGTFEGGEYTAGDKKGQFLKINAAIKQQVRFTLGQWNYMFEAGKIFGAVPYNLLEIPLGNEGIAYKRNLFSVVRDMEYAFDHFAALH